MFPGAVHRAHWPQPHRRSGCEGRELGLRKRPGNLGSAHRVRPALYPVLGDYLPESVWVGRPRDLDLSREPDGLVSA